MKKLSLLFSLVLFPTIAQAQWVKMGETVVNHKAEKDTLHCAHQGPLNGIQFRVKHNDVRVFRFQVVYGNGQQQTIPVNAVIRAGQSSGYIDLPGVARVVRSVHFWYKTLNHRGPKAHLALYGRQAAAAPPPPPPVVHRPQWTKIGETLVNHKAERDTLRTTHQGLLKGFQFRVTQADVRVFRFEVTYASGQKQLMQVNAVVRAGQSSGYIDLPGNARAVRSISFWYKTLNPRGPRARVAVWGRN